MSATPVAYKLLSRHAASLRYPVDSPPILPCCDITNDCGIFISIINLIYVATVPAAAFIVRIINAPLQPPQPCPPRTFPAIEVIYYFYTFHVRVRMCVCVFCGTHFIHYT